MSNLSYESQSLFYLIFNLHLWKMKNSLVNLQELRSNLAHSALFLSSKALFKHITSYSNSFHSQLRLYGKYIKVLSQLTLKPLALDLGQKAYHIKNRQNVNSHTYRIWKT